MPIRRRKRDKEHRLQFILSRPHRSFRWRGEPMKKTRREFLRNTACGLTAAAVVNSLDRLSIVNAMVQQQPEVAADYKALVCVFLSGGSEWNKDHAREFGLGSICPASKFVARGGECRAVAWPHGTMEPG